MAELSQQVSNWLYNVIEAQYKHKEVVYSHVYRFLQLHMKQGLQFKVRTKVHTSSLGGQSNLLINLFATIRINDSISVPVEIWVPLGYPYPDRSSNAELNGAPLVYVVPDHSKNWYLKANNCFDTQGKFYHPYLSDWFGQCFGPEALQRYNLLTLVSIVADVVMHEPPIQLPIQSTSTSAKSSIGPHTEYPAVSSVRTSGPQLPPKPAKVPLYASGVTSPVSTGHVPLKYQAPLPLPSEQSASTPVQDRQFQRQNHYQEVHRQEILSERRDEHEQFQPQRQEAQRQNGSPQSYVSPVQTPYPHSQNSSSSHSPYGAVTSPPSNFTPTDLVDNDDRSTGLSTASLIKTELLELISQNINSFLHTDSINALLPQVQQNEVKVNALHSQLSSHYEKAKANSQILDDHLSQVTQQLTRLSNLNSTLQRLDTLNNDYFDKVYTSETHSILIDDIIIPDSPLIKQLYETVSEIKAIKDTINLIGGNFNAQPEIINDERLGVCVKTVRNLGRELFWLELTKNEISTNILGLRGTS